MVLADLSLYSRAKYKPETALKEAVWTLVTVTIYVRTIYLKRRRGDYHVHKFADRFIYCYYSGFNSRSGIETIN